MLSIKLKLSVFMCGNKKTCSRLLLDLFNTTFLPCTLVIKLPVEYLYIFVPQQLLHNGTGALGLVLFPLEFGFGLFDHLLLLFQSFLHRSNLRLKGVGIAVGGSQLGDSLAQCLLNHRHLLGIDPDIFHQSIDFPLLHVHPMIALFLQPLRRPLANNILESSRVINASPNSKAIRVGIALEADKVDLVALLLFHKANELTGRLGTKAAGLHELLSACPHHVDISRQRSERSSPSLLLQGIHLHLRQTAPLFRQIGHSAAKHTSDTSNAVVKRRRPNRQMHHRYNPR
mmetsp:Transcript_15491/g.44851  ORF Transcript_15491/g.44851 Transcript_15491/m.44851 type:complete len:286 (+) Transcript_15491:1418-2275(+)